MNDNSKCIIIQQNKNYPEMPLVKRITDQSGNMLKVPSLVQITRHGSVKIAAVTSAEEIKSFLKE